MQMKQSHWLLCVAKAFLLVQENNATVKLDSMHAASLLEGSSITEQTFELKSLDAALDIAGFGNVRSENFRLRSTMEVIQFDF